MPIDPSIPINWPTVLATGATAAIASAAINWAANHWVKALEYKNSLMKELAMKRLQYITDLRAEILKFQDSSPGMKDGSFIGGFRLALYPRELKRRMDDLVHFQDGFVWITKDTAFAFLDFTVMIQSIWSKAANATDEERAALSQNVGVHVFSGIEKVRYMLDCEMLEVHSIRKLRKWHREKHPSKEVGDFLQDFNRDMAGQ
jgi:hypothetical protein